jgi:hypothetical protein
MIGLILAIAAAPVQPAVAVSPAPVRPPVAGMMLETRDQRIADARALLNQAERARMLYRPGATSGQLSKAELEASIAETRDSLSDMGEMNQVQLQTAMDRLSKAMAVLSNVLKKYKDTSDAIVKNIR